MPINNIIPGQKIAPNKIQRARELRREMTPAEKMLWQALRGKSNGCTRPIESMVQRAWFQSAVVV